MDDRRHHSRHGTDRQLEIFDQHSDRRLGRVVDLSVDGFMLLGDSPHMADMLVECRLVCAQPIEGVDEILFAADCLWSKPGADAQHCWAGFHIIDIADDQLAALQVLIDHL